MEEKLSYDEETFNEKIKRKAGIFTLIGTAILSILHTLSHIVPAIGILGFSFGEGSGLFYDIISNEYMQFVYLIFVVLSFYYIYRDHKHHKHEHELRKKLCEAEQEIETLKKLNK